MVCLDWIKDYNLCLNHSNRMTNSSGLLGLSINPLGDEEMRLREEYFMLDASVGVG